MLETVKQYIADLPQEDFNTYYQKYVLAIQDENIGLEYKQEITFSDINKLISKIQQELKNIS